MPEEKKKQTSRYSEQELSVIKNTFKDNDDLLKAIRKVMLQMPLNAVDLSLLGMTRGEDVLKIVRKTLLPTLDGDMPLTQQMDLWLTINLKELMPDVGAIHLKSVKTWIDYTDQQLSVLESGKYNEKQRITLKALEDFRGKDDNELYGGVLARNTIINSVEQQLNFLLAMANLKEETPEQKSEREKKNSSK